MGAARGGTGTGTRPGMGEFEVHRVRFFGLVPAGVRCLAWQPRSARLALARTDGTVEIYNFAANYFQEKVRGPDRVGPGRTELCRAVPERTVPYGTVLSSTGSHRAVLGCAGLYRAVLSCTELYRAVQGCTGPGGG